MYKLMTGRVPFRGKSKQLLRERIITSPLKWPRADEHPHSATTPAKDMTYRMLKKNPVERLGSRNYSDLKTHPFFDQFNWQMLYNKTDLCEIPSIAEIMNSDAAKDSKTVDPDDKRKHQQIDEMTDVSAESQKPLLCYASPSFKKLMLKVKASKTTIKLSDSFMESSGQSSTVIDYKANSPMSMSRTAPLSSMEGKDSVTTEKVDLMLYRKKKYLKFWGFGFSLRRVQGEEASLTYVDYADVVSSNNRMVFPGDVLFEIDGTKVEGMSRMQVDQILGAGKPEVTLSVAPLSPLRKRRFLVSKLHETGMTDINVPSKSTAADID